MEVPTPFMDRVVRAAHGNGGSWLGKLIAQVQQSDLNFSLCQPMSFAKGGHVFGAGHRLWQNCQPTGMVGHNPPIKDYRNR